MAPRPSSLAAAGLMLLGAIVTGDVDPVATARAAPLTVAAALGLDDPTASADLDRRRAVAVAWLTARCMAGRGFSHIAVVESAPEIPDGDLDPVAWAERWGFGISTAPSTQAAQETPDPNLVRIAELPRTARREALRALLGNDRTAGCAALAGRTVHGLRDRELAPLRNELADVAAAVERDVGSRRALDRWKACVGTDTGRSDYLASLMDGFQRRTAAVRDRRGPLTLLQSEERRVAATVARCDMIYGAARARVRERWEAPFVSEHRVTLAAIGARIRRVEAAYPYLAGSVP